MMRTVRPTPAVIALAAALLLAACVPAGPPAAPAAGPGAAATAPAAGAPAPAAAARPSQPAKVVLAHAAAGAATQFWVAYAAQKKGFFAQEAIDFEAIGLQSAPNQTQALLAGDVQVIGFTVLSMATAIAAGAPLKLVVASQDAPTIQMLVRPEIGDWADLRGKALGSGNTAGDYFDIALRLMLAANGLHDGDYTVRNMPTAARLPAILAGQLAGGVGSSQETSTGLASGLRSLGSFTDYVKDVSYTGFLVNESWATANDEALVRFIRALLRGMAWLYDPANEGEAIALYAEEAGQPAPEVAPIYGEVIGNRLLPRDLRPNRKGIENILNLAHEQGALPEIPPLDTWIDLSYLDRASR
ncbi:MAG TPA: ABC transporter substrate-binding protein [Chloroflexota bacterium]|nr:ABC transporter substrate-binding protein [Chloroflexota bacterium]